VSFRVDSAAAAGFSTPIAVCDQPLARAITDGNGQALPAAWTDGAVNIDANCGCVVTTLQKQLSKQNLTTEAAFDFEGLRKFRNGFLRRYQQGEEYIKMYYAFRKHFKTDPASLLKAAAALPHLYKAINALENASSNAVVVTPELRRAMLAVLESHREIEDHEFQKILARIENDLNAYQGLTRNKLLSRMGRVEDDKAGAPETQERHELATLDQNYPQPFNPSTTIRYALGEDAHVTLKIYNVLGEEVLTLVEGEQAAGQKAVVWNGKNRAGQAAPSGMYFLRMSVRTEAGETRMLTRKMLMMEIAKCMAPRVKAWHVSAPKTTRKLVIASRSFTSNRLEKYPNR